MIRDPSDGTVRSGHHPKPLAKPTIRPESDVLSITTSGLETETLKADELARLEKSRDWLKSYFHRRVIPSPDSGEG